MNYSKEENGNIIVSNENEKYTFMNMGEYVGHESRDWYEEAPDHYKLMMYDREGLHMEALVNSLGEYNKIMVITNDARRVFNPRGIFVEEDTIYEMTNEDMLSKETYSAFNHNGSVTDPLPKVEDYLQTPKTFVNEAGKAYEGEVTNNDYITGFMKANDELLPGVIEYASNEEMNL